MARAAPITIAVRAMPDAAPAFSGHRGERALVDERVVDPDAEAEEREERQPDGQVADERDPERARGAEERGDRHQGPTS